MIFESIVPILYSADVARSLAYYMDQLAFDEKWEWDNPITFGGVSKDCVRIFFCLKHQGNPGTWIAVNLDNVDEYYETIKARGARILSPPEDKEWFMREMLVADPDGHIIRFGKGIE
jgi:catechol 2,3-dioxygenase-like lactoylglutathione lyase family enzyme